MDQARRAFASSRPRSAPTFVLVLLASAALLFGPLIVAHPGSTAGASSHDRNPILDFLRSIEFPGGIDVSVDGEIVSIDDTTDDIHGSAADGLDILMFGMGWIGNLPPEVLDQFGCDRADVVCSRHGSDDAAFAEGAAIVHQRIAKPLSSVPATKRVEWGVMTLRDQFPPKPAAPNQPADLLQGASHYWIARMMGSEKDLFLFVNNAGQLGEFRTHARSTYVDGPTSADLYLLVPASKEWTDITNWDVYGFCSDGTPEGTGRDIGRAQPGDGLFEVGTPAQIEFGPAAPAPTDTPAPTAVPSREPSVTASPSPQETPSPSPGSDAGFPTPVAIAGLGLGALLALIGLWLLLGHFRGSGGKPGGGKADSGLPTDAPVPPDAPQRPDAPEPPDDPSPVKPGGPVVSGGDGPPPVPPPPAPGAIPPPPPPPKDPCEDMPDQWREDRPPESFVVPAPDGKVRIEADPTTPAIEAWLDGFGIPRGVPYADFVAVDDQRLDVLLADLPTGSNTYHWAMSFMLHEYVLVCQRRWTCQDGVYVPTNETRIVRTGPADTLGRLTRDGERLTDADIRDLFADVAVALNGAEAAIRRMNAYEAACG